MATASSIAFFIGLILIGFIVYLTIKDWVFGKIEEGYEMNNQPAEGPLEIRQSPLAPPRTITSSGPSPPSQEAPEGEVVIYGDPHARDPYADKHEASDAPENLRYPERAFRPSVPNDQVVIADEAGIAGGPGQHSPQNYQSFNTEFVQNSGAFMGGVYANDTTSPTNFSTI
jgi:hypothetical protein